MRCLAISLDTNVRVGNHYAIQNEHGKAARIFFSQGCEAPPDV